MDVIRKVLAEELRGVLTDEGAAELTAKIMAALEAEGQTVAWLVRARPHRNDGDGHDNAA